MGGGDFNWHHPLWDNKTIGHRLFTRQALAKAEGLIQIIAKWNMSMILPKGLPTLQHWVSTVFSRPDNVFGSEGVEDMLV